MFKFHDSRWQKSDSSPAGNRTRVFHVTGGDTHHYTTEDMHLLISNEKFSFHNIAFMIIFSSPPKKKKSSLLCGKKTFDDRRFEECCIGRESNPDRPRGRRAFYHWTTDADESWPHTTPQFFHHYTSNPHA